MVTSTMTASGFDTNILGDVRNIAHPCSVFNGMSMLTSSLLDPRLWLAGV
jgi:hypothetical protein